MARPPAFLRQLFSPMNDGRDSRQCHFAADSAWRCSISQPIQASPTTFGIGLAAGAIVGHHAAREAKGSGGGGERKIIAVHPGVEALRRRETGLALAHVIEIVGAEIDGCVPSDRMAPQARMRRGEYGVIRDGRQSWRISDPARVSSQVKVSPVDQRMDSTLFGNVRTSSILGGFMDLRPSNRLTTQRGSRQPIAAPRVAWLRV